MSWRRVLTWDVVPEELAKGRRVKVLDSTYIPGAATRSFIGKTGTIIHIGEDMGEPYVSVEFAPNVYWNYAPEDLEIVG